MGFELLASAPERGVDYRSTVFSVRAYKPFQTLFGFDAQLYALDALARRHGGRVSVTTLPQLFTDRLAPEILSRVRGLPADTTFGAHVRLGPVARMRVVRGLSNVALLAEDASPPLANLGLHPFGDGVTAPAAFDRALCYGPVRGPLRRAGGPDLACEPLPDAFAVADLLQARESATAPDDEDEDDADVRLPAGLQVQTASDFEPGRWAPTAHNATVISQEFWRLERERQAAAGAGRPAVRHVMIPLNLMHPAAAAADLAAKLVSFADRRPGFRPVLFPYNPTFDGAAVLGRALHHVRTTAGGTTPMRNVFVARMATLQGFEGLAGMFSAAWLDAADPEHAWVARRLQALGIATVVFGGSAPAGEQAFPADETRQVSVHDDFGLRVFARPEVSLRTIGRALARDPGAGTTQLVDNRDEPGVAAVFQSLSAGPRVRAA